MYQFNQEIELKLSSVHTTHCVSTYDKKYLSELSVKKKAPGQWYLLLWQERQSHNLLHILIHSAFLCMFLSIPRSPIFFPSALTPMEKAFLLLLPWISFDNPPFSCQTSTKKEVEPVLFCHLFCEGTNRKQLGKGAFTESREKRNNGIIC